MKWNLFDFSELLSPWLYISSNTVILIESVNKEMWEVPIVSTIIFGMGFWNRKGTIVRKTKTKTNMNKSCTLVDHDITDLLHKCVRIDV